MEEREPGLERPDYIDIGAVVAGAIGAVAAYNTFVDANDALRVASYIAPVGAIPYGYELLNRWFPGLWEGEFGRAFGGLARGVMRSSEQVSYDVVRAVVGAVLGAVVVLPFIIAWGLVASFVDGLISG